MKNFSYAHGVATMILVGEKMGLEINHVDDAKKQMSGEKIHPIAFSGMEKESVILNDVVRASPALLDVANAHVETIKAEYGFTA